MMEITEQMRIKIFAQHIETLAINRTDNDKNYASIVIYDHQMSEINIRDWSLLLKPLSAISDAEAIAVANMCTREKINLKEIKRTSLVTIIEYEDVYCKGTMATFNFHIHHNGMLVTDSLFVNPLDCLKAYQYLQSRGYALGYLNYTVEDLINTNVYKIIE